MARIFISYRRKDTEAIVGRLYDRLESSFGSQNVFKDVDDIPPGVDFRSVLSKTIASSDVVLIVIGPDWLDIRDSQGNRRLESPADYTRIEVEQALASKRVIVIPTLVMGAVMPSPEALPPSIRDLAFRNAVSVRNDPDFSRDIVRLIEQISRGPRRASFPLARLAGVAGIVLAVAVLVALGPSLAGWLGDLTSGSPNRPGSSAQEVHVDGSDGWVDTGIYVDAGQIINFGAEGEVNVWPNCESEKHEFDVAHIDCRSLVSGPDGGVLRDLEGHILESPPDDLPAPNLRFWSLIGRIGSRGEPFLVGSQNQIESPTSGNVQLRINDQDEENEGAFIVFIELMESAEPPS